MKKDITLTQKEFTRRIAGTTGMANEEAEKIVQIIVKEITSCLLDGIGIKFRGLGTFMVKSKAARVFINPITKLAAQNPKKIARKYRPSKKLRERMNGNYIMAGGWYY